MYEMLDKGMSGGVSEYCLYDYFDIYFVQSTWLISFLLTLYVYYDAKGTKYNQFTAGKLADKSHPIYLNNNIHKNIIYR